MLIDNNSPHNFVYTNQCVQTAPFVDRSCYCRACASLPEWDHFEAFCRRFAPPEVPECHQLATMLSVKCDGDGSGGDSIEADRAHEHPRPVAAPPADQLAIDRAATAAAHCRTAFNTSCCPAPPVTPLAAAHASAGAGGGGGGTPSEPCGGRGRGVCVPIEAWLDAQV